jgi:hypothetical protein
MFLPEAVVPLSYWRRMGKGEIDVGVDKFYSSARMWFRYASGCAGRYSTTAGKVRFLCVCNGSQATPSIAKTVFDENRFIRFTGGQQPGDT